MTLQAGVCIGPYEVLAPLGAGGMGEVYRARDTQLGREVALKILPAHLVSDPDRVARFQREARTLAALNHPNIGVIHGLEHTTTVTALVLELVEGPTLADRLEAGPMPLDAALQAAQQIAAALETAHEQGIIHRDLKPSNIKLREEGTVKVLDFGLAKVQPADRPDSDAGPSQSPTVTSPAATSAGVILGTAAYMSPEQARGRVVDKRTDIWAFGCVLFEMLTGRRPFGGDTVSDVLASILAREPDLTALPAATPPAIRKLLRRCLQKDRQDRLRDIGDARIEIRDALATGDADQAPPEATRRQIAPLAVAAAGVVVLAAVLLVGWRLRPLPAEEIRLDINVPQTSAPASLALSPDGRTIAFVATADRVSRLWLRPLDTGRAQPLRGTEGASYPFWSPDGRSIAFFADSQIKRIDLDGEAVRALVRAHRGTGGTWNRDGTLVYSSLGAPMSRVSASGGNPLELQSLVQIGSNFTPHFLPDGQHFLYYVRADPNARGIYVGHLQGTADPRRVVEADGGGVYSPSGHLLFVRQNTLFAQPFDTTTLTVTARPIAIAENVANCACVSVSQTGAIAYRAAGPPPRRQFVWFDRAGKELEGVEAARTGMSQASFSPDGGRVLGYRGVDGNVDVWSFDLRRDVYTRLTSDPADDVAPAWSSDGNFIVFASNRRGPHDLYRKPAGPGGAEELLLASAEQKVPTDWSSDGRYVIFESRDANASSDIKALPLLGTGQPFIVANTRFDEQRAQLSPDGRWIAYQSDESGREEIYVQPFPEAGASKWTVSTAGGTQVRWRRDGRELFYVGWDGRLMSVTMTLVPAGRPPELSAPTPLFAPPLGGMIQQGDFRHQYMVTNDGGRFLIGTISESANVPITVILNWRSGIARAAR